MTPGPPDAPHPVDDAVARARAWIAEADASRDEGRDGGSGRQRTADRLAALVADPAGLDLAVRFVDEVARPPDLHVAAHALTRLGRDASSASFLGAVDRRLFAVGARAATVLPAVVVPAARRRLRALVGHLVGDTGHGLENNLGTARVAGSRLNVNLLGEAVLGHDEAAARLARTVDLVRRPGVDYVSVKVSAVAAQLVPWDLDGSRARVARHLLPLFRAALESGTFVNLDMEEYRDLALTVAVCTDLLGRDELRDLSAGIALQAYLPDAVAALDEVTAFAQRRVDAGGAPVKVRLVKGANLAMEQVEAELHDWAQAPYETKAEVDANYVRLLLRGLVPERTRAVRIGCASHNLFHVAYALEVARARGVDAALDIEMLQGMAPAEADAVHDDLAAVEGADHLVLYTPVVDPSDFDVAVAYLVRRLEENAAPQNFLHATLAGGAAGIDAQERAFRDAVARAAQTVPDDLRPRRRTRPAASPAGTPAVPATSGAPSDGTGADDAGSGPGAGLAGFSNAPDTDPAVAASRDWAAEIVGRDPATARPRTSPLATVEDVDAVVARAAAAAPAWSATPPAERARVLAACADELEAARAELVAAMVHEAGKTVAEADPEVSEAVDFARWYAGSAARLDPAHPDALPGATFTPRGVTLVTPPWNFPVSIPAGGLLAALAAGSAVIAKPAHPTPRCFEVVVEAVHAAFDACGVGPDLAHDVVQLVRVPEAELGRHLVTHPGIDRVLLTGSIDTARLFAGWRPGLDVLAETSGKNAIVVTPSADPDLAVADVVRSAFGHAGQKCSAASLLILVGAAGDPRSAIGARLRRGLVSAVGSLAVGWPTDLGAVMGPLTEPAEGKLLRALTRLDPGERWLVEPRRLDDAGRLWTPGLKDGVAQGSWFHRTECFGPVLGVMTATTLDDAVALQDEVAFGLTGGIHSLDDAEIDRWLGTVHVGNAYVNRYITGAIVRRQPFGGWKASVVGPGAKAGGPHYVAQLGDWSDAPADAGGPPDREESPVGWLSWAATDDARTWASRFSREHDPSGLRAESNVLRYRPVEHLTVRVGDGALPVEVDRVRHAARTAGVTVTVSDVDRERHASFAARVRSGGVVGRVRVVGAAPGLREAAVTRVGEVTVLDGPVVASGERELLAVVREQAVSRTRHRYGHLER